MVINTGIEKSKTLVYLLLLFLSISNLKANFYLLTKGGITIPYETTIVGSIEKLLNKYGLELPADGDFGNPNRLGFGMNYSSGYNFTNSFSVTLTTGYWYYRNLNKYGLFTFKTIPFNLGIEHNILEFAHLKFVAGLEFPFFYNIALIESEVSIPGNDKLQRVIFSDNYLLYGLNFTSLIEYLFSERLSLNFSQIISYIPRSNKPLLFFNYFLGLKYWI